MAAVLHTEHSITELLRNNNRAVERGILRIFQNQTSDEQESKSTRWVNGKGFNSSDARLGTYYAGWVGGGKSLSGKHLERARRMAIKYRKQLLEVANAR